MLIASSCLFDEAEGVHKAGEKEEDRKAGATGDDEAEDGKLEE